MATERSEEEVLNEEILLNQIGYYPKGKKTAVYKGKATPAEFQIINQKNNQVVYSGKLGEQKKSLYSSAITCIADFTAVETSGVYYIAIPGVGKSHVFEIKEAVNADLLKASIKSYYFQRTFMPLTEEFAGKWARDAGHPDTLVFIHASAATAKRPEGTIISSPYGWYDAGDYNKYIVNSGISVGTLLSLYEDFPEYFKKLVVDIPESSNQLPDLLDEALFNIKWMLSMQDPEDGGVYHKLTTANFEGMIMPAEAKNKRYVVQKSVTATLDFAAVMAQAARVFAPFENQLPGFADSCRVAAEKAWDWAQKNPDKLYFQNEMNKQFSPAIHTGGYGDRNADDEKAWAAAELWITTGDEKYRHEDTIVPNVEFKVPGWSNVRAMGYYSILRHSNRLEANDLVIKIQDQLLKKSEELAGHLTESPYGVVMGGKSTDFVWGSNAVAANQGIALLYAYKITMDKKYLEAAVSNLDYLLGKNATGYSFVTGYGDKTPMHPHHRPSIADGIKDPVPGLLAGGPNPGQQDNCDYPSDNAEESYVDHDCSYASNEVAINWNAPLVYLVGAVEAIYE